MVVLFLDDVKRLKPFGKQNERFYPKCVWVNSYTVSWRFLTVNICTRDTTKKIRFAIKV